MSSIFTIKNPSANNSEFNIILNQPIWITDDVYALKRETKRVLLEMIDVYSNLILGYSGGTDTAFILCCIRDLINEKKIPSDTIKIVQGIFTANGISLTMDTKRAYEFAEQLGFSPIIHEFDINEKWYEIEKYFMNFYLSGKTSITFAAQYLWADEQDGYVIKGTDGDITAGVGPNGLSLTLEHFRFSNLWCLWNLPNNSVSLSTWDNRIYSAFITPYRLNSTPINLEPYDIAKKNNSSSPSSMFISAKPLKGMEKTLWKWMLYFQCYPELTQLFGKFFTIDWSIWKYHAKDFINLDRMNEFRNLVREIDEQITYVKHPNGNLFSKKDLINYEKYCSK